MKNLVLGALCVAAASSAACSSSSTTDVTVTAHWSFKHIADGSARSCPTGFDTATVFAQPVDDLTAAANGGLISADLFNCSDGAGTVVVPDGLYLMSVRIENHSGSTKYADSDSVFIDTASASSFSVEILDDGGYITFRWTLKDKTTGATLTCAQAGVTSSGSVESISTSIADPTVMLTDKFTCEDHFGTTDGLPADDYTVSIDAEENNAALGAPVNMSPVTVGAPNVVTDIGLVSLPID